MPLPPSTCKGRILILDRLVDGGRRKGLRILCVHVCGTPRVRAYAEGP